MKVAKIRTKVPNYEKLKEAQISKLFSPQERRSFFASFLWTKLVKVDNLQEQLNGVWHVCLAILFPHFHLGFVHWIPNYASMNVKRKDFTKKKHQWRNQFLFVLFYSNWSGEFFFHSFVLITCREILKTFSVVKQKGKKRMREILFVSRI